MAARKALSFHVDMDLTASTEAIEIPSLAVTRIFDSICLGSPQRSASQYPISMEMIGSVTVHSHTRSSTHIH